MGSTIRDQHQLLTQKEVFAHLIAGGTIVSPKTGNTYKILDGSVWDIFNQCYSNESFHSGIWEKSESKEISLLRSAHNLLCQVRSRVVKDSIKPENKGLDLVSCFMEIGFATKHVERALEKLLAKGGMNGNESV